jgi:hypothetical protein
MRVKVHNVKLFKLLLQARIGGCASNLGVAAGTFVALAEKFGGGNVSAVPTMVVQWTLAANLTTAITFFDPPLTARGDDFAALQIAGAYAVPPDVDAGNPTTHAVTDVELDAWLASYKSGILTGKVVVPPRPPSPPSPPSPVSPGYCMRNSSWFAYVPDWNLHPKDHGTIVAKSKPSYNCKLGALLKKCTGKSTFLPAADIYCVKPGTVVKIIGEVRASENKGLDIVNPVFAADGGVDGENGGGRSTSTVLATSNATSSLATRAGLFKALEALAVDTAAHAMVKPTASQGMFSWALLGAWKLSDPIQMLLCFGISQTGCFDNLLISPVNYTFEVDFNTCVQCIAYNDTS